MARILVTNGGPHPPEKWAIATAERIFDIEQSVAGDRFIQAQKFQLSIAELLMPYQETIQTAERSKLAENAEHIMSPHDADTHVEKIINDIVATAKGTPWQAHFAREDVQRVAREVIGGHIKNSQHIERLWHADNNPDCAISQSYKAIYQGA